LNARATFSVQHLLNMQDHRSMICHVHQQSRHVDDSEVAGPAAESGSLLSSVVHCEPMTTLPLAGACSLAGRQMSLSPRPVATSPSRHGRYADMPDLVQASYLVTTCCQQDNPGTSTWIQSSDASTDYYSGLHVRPPILQADIILDELNLAIKPHYAINYLWWPKYKKTARSSMAIDRDKHKIMSG